ncbi:hypothetical protein [Flavobacterium sp.]|uniref:hypothetical protein n=1 Tax=Flavobacterium sp. TaxID=239 RepID=UPI0038FC56EC
MVKINDYGNINAPEFPNGESETKEKFIELILKKAPKFSTFCIHEIANKLELSELEKRQFNYLKYEIRSDLDKNGLAKFPIKGNSDIMLTEGGRHYFELKHPNTILADTYVGGDISGVYLSRSNLKNTEIKHNDQPKANDNKNNKIISFIVKFWWQILIPLTFVILSAILSSKRVMNFINKNINDLNF